MQLGSIWCQAIVNKCEHRVMKPLVLSSLKFVNEPLHIVAHLIFKFCSAPPLQKNKWTTKENNKWLLDCLSIHGSTWLQYFFVIFHFHVFVCKCIQLQKKGKTSADQKTHSKVSRTPQGTIVVGFYDHIL